MEREQRYRKLAMVAIPTEEYGKILEENRALKAYQAESSKQLNELVMVNQEKEKEIEIQRHKHKTLEESLEKANLEVETLRKRAEEAEAQAKKYRRKYMSFFDVEDEELDPRSSLYL